MENIYYLLALFLVCWYFIYLRQLAEYGSKHVQAYCQKEQLQFISLARRFSRPAFSKRNGLYILSVFDFEFSSDGESSYQGSITMVGNKLESTYLPPFRMN